MISLFCGFDLTSLLLQMFGECRMGGNVVVQTYELEISTSVYK